LEREERKTTIELEKKLKEEQNKFKEEQNKFKEKRKKLNFNKMALNKLEEQFHLQQQRIQLVINAVEKQGTLDDDDKEHVPVSVNINF
jgi:hypothetical protein